MASGILGSTDLSANSDTSVYTVPSSTYSVVTVSVCNRHATNTANIRLAIGTSGTPGAADYIEYDVAVGPNGVLERTGIVAQAARQVIVRSSQASVTAVVMGIETAVPA
ncbi:MAG: hypothetical protein CMC89_01095 [Flavobacteriaceae bacterium]|jgi:hypothetical protein|nr:hypothetical protein [Flavobacteriaceae bacterium]|tara:strand:+ start:20795 stop:21121 length:327 start_codon:yes stop_codon:yes gene_type:complete